MASNLHIPDDIIKSNILTRLPVRSLVRFKCVSKTWQHNIGSMGSHTSLIFTTHENNESIYQLIDLQISTSPRAIEHPLPSSFRENRYYITIEGSCHDLFLLQTGGKYLLWSTSNPTAFHELSLVEERLRGIEGFGYDRYSDNYKLIVTQHGPDPLWGCVTGQVYHSKTLDSWVPVGISEPIPRISSTFNNSNCLNNCLHWLSEENNYDVIKIINFDLHDETWGTPFSLLVDGYIDAMDVYSLGIYGGMLGLVVKDIESKKRDLWVMKEYGVNESWTKLFSLPPHDYKTTNSGHLRNSRVLLLNWRKRSLVWYDDHLQEENSIEEIEIQGRLHIRQANISQISLV